MSARLSTAQARLLPHGPLDVVRQVALFVAAFQLYRLVRGLANDPGSANAAFSNARDLIHAEQALNIFIEPSLQAFAAGQTWLLDGASWMYINTQTSITLGALTWLYLFRNESFYFVRNMFLVAFGVALIGYTVFPTAPPRFFPEWGFFDAVSDFTGVAQDSVTINELFNPYAAVPSMHVGFALMISIPLARLVRWRALKVFWAVYPLLVLFVIVVTANHFLADAVLGAVAAGLGALAARALAKTRPHVWAFAPGRTAEARVMVARTAEATAP
ncbi:MAG TPA: phosphatase PAP2 family protein [Solirubrobacteraceae bacterium]|nr:phosphatase PAP2 family protein [Solirubrobacteraceae bacterium]